MGLHALHRKIVFKFLSRIYASPCIDKNRLIYQATLILSLFVLPSTIFAQPTFVINTAGEVPLSTESHNGFLDEIAKNIFNKIGYTLVIEKLPAERALSSVNDGTIDGELIRVGGMEKIYPNLIPLSEKIMTTEFFVFSKKPINVQQGWNALASKDVAYINGWKIMEKNVPKTAFVTKVNNSKQLFFLLEKDRTDFVLFEHWGGNFIINQTRQRDVNMIQPPLATKDMYLYVHKKHRALVPKLSKALADMKKDGSYERLADKHLLPIQKIK